MDADLEKCSYAHRQVDDEQRSKSSEKNGDKSAVAMSKITRQLGCVLQDMEPPKSTTIMRKSSNKLKPIRCVRLTKAVVRHADIRDQNPSLGMICPGDPHQRNPKSQNLRIGLRKRWNGRSDVPVKQRGGWPKKSSKLMRNIKQHSSHLRRIGVYLRHQPLNQRKEKLLLTPERRCT